MNSRSVALLATLLALSTLTVDGEAQVRRGRAPEPSARWSPIAVGVRGGWDQRANAEVLGAHLRVPVLRSGIVELVPNGEVAFLRGAKDYQYGVDAAWVPGGARGGVFLSAGIAWRDTPIASLDTGDVRETYFGWVAGAGGKTGVGRMQLEVDLRWVFLNDTSYRPNSATLGINFPFWRIGPGDGS